MVLLGTNYANRRNASAQHVELLGGFVGEVDDAVAGERAAVVDAHDDAFIVIQIGHSHQRAEGQGAMGGGQLVLVEALATGGTFALVFGAVIGGLAFGAVAAVVRAEAEG